VPTRKAIERQFVHTHGAIVDPVVAFFLSVVGAELGPLFPGEVIANFILSAFGGSRACAMFRLLHSLVV
jgi:hypothetical protein